MPDALSYHPEKHNSRGDQKELVCLLILGVKRSLDRSEGARGPSRTWWRGKRHPTRNRPVRPGLNR